MGNGKPACMACLALPLGFLRLLACGCSRGGAGGFGDVTPGSTGDVMVGDAGDLPTAMAGLLSAAPGTTTACFCCCAAAPAALRLCR